MNTLINITSYFFSFDNMLFVKLSSFILLILFYENVYKHINKHINKNVIKNNEKNEESIPIQIPIVKYEDKYLDKYKNFTNDLTISEEYLKMENDKYEELLSFCLEKKDSEIKLLEEQKNTIIVFILQFNLEKDHDELKEIQIKIDGLQEFQPDLNEIRKETNEYISNKIFDNLINSYIFEKTPLGNVAMCFNNKKGSFEYYSDNTIPYRFLETVARKYVITFHCKKLYVDMNEELNNAKLKQTQEKKDQKEKEEQFKDTLLKTKDVFARLKNYSNNNNNNNSNNNNNRQRNNTNTHSKGSKNNNNNNNNTNQKSENMILKENANRYTHNGKFANFIMLKKVDKKIVDKNYALNYKDFAKKMIEMKI